MKKLFILLALFALSACATSPTGRSQLMLVSPEQAISSSREAYVQTLLPLQKEGKVDSSPTTSKRIKLITGRIIAQAVQRYPHTRNWEWTVKVIDDPETVNAWCMAGGKMAIYTGLINKLQATDDEIAQVMGHEISHALANHTAERMSMALATQLGLSGVAIAAGDSVYKGAILSGSSLAAATAVTLPNSRTSETEADQMGIELAARAGYDPRAAVTLWQKMAKVGGNSPPQFLSTHPSPANRQQRLGVLAEQMMVYYRDTSTRPVYQLQ
ncbi:M48 family metallopeptidase [Desulfopila sp. IMCC35006]|uniref:M48 family metallopeptidase n=1 Tax=Desulfopila sp. IMCC35006 TaxID=2569542 RepID=UPI0010AC5ED6|nr:M48 family metallopeptidase [Desulfopila sp. IMCC35006]TKB26930.1 M48 family metallopeptidase [Desulfopila sp. IMCC35006]